MFGEARKVDEKMQKRIIELVEQGVTQEIVAIRLGISSRTVRAYLRSHRLGLKPYEKPKKEDVQS